MANSRDISLLEAQTYFVSFADRVCFVRYQHCLHVEVDGEVYIVVSLDEITRRLWVCVYGRESVAQFRSRRLANDFVIDVVESKLREVSA